MPKEQFLKLKPLKKEKIIIAARDEFSCKSYDEVSINEIVSKSGISRGSFYLYFEDKWDVYSYLLKCTTSKIIGRVADCLKRGNSIFFAFLDVYDYMIIESNVDENIGFISHILNKITPQNYTKLFDYLLENENKDFIEEYVIKKEDFLINTEIEFNVLKNLLVNNLINSIVKVLIFKRDPHEVREELRISYNILKYGSYK